MSTYNTICRSATQFPQQNNCTLTFLFFEGAPWKSPSFGGVSEGLVGRFVDGGLYRTAWPVAARSSWPAREYWPSTEVTPNDFSLAISLQNKTPVISIIHSTRIRAYRKYHMVLRHCPRLPVSPYDVSCPISTPSHLMMSLVQSWLPVSPYDVSCPVWPFKTSEKMKYCNITLTTIHWACIPANKLTIVKDN